ncbi:MAG: exodeoxyribonuclease VII small subunit [Acidobacteria bacterium]|nr:exodeoxyribonuclease VII small subunit [Acidobacteriota bacterium]
MEKSFETSLSDLEKIVAQLEAGDLPLEQSLELFEQGVKLSRECRYRLAKAEQRIEMLVRDSKGDLAVAPVDPDSLRD